MIPINQAAQHYSAVKLPSARSADQTSEADKKLLNLSSSIILINGIQGGFISRDKRAQLQELGITEEQLQTIESGRCRLLGGMMRSTLSHSGEGEDPFDISSRPAKPVKSDADKITELTQNRSFYSMIFSGQDELTSLIARANGWFGDGAIVQIRKLVEKDRIPIGRVEELLNLLIRQIEHGDRSREFEVLLTINWLAMCDRIPIGRVDEVLRLCLRKLDEKNPVSGIQYGNPVGYMNILCGLATSNKISIERVDEVLNYFITQPRESSSLQGIGHLITNRKIPVGRSDKLLSLLISNIIEPPRENLLYDHADSVSGHSRSVDNLANLIINYQFPERRFKEVLNLIFSIYDDSSTMGYDKGKKYSGNFRNSSKKAIGLLAAEDKIPPEMIDRALDIAIRESDIRSINNLANNNKIPTKKINNVLDALMNGGDYYAYLFPRIDVILKLAEQGNIPFERIEEVLNRMLSLRAQSDEWFKDHSFRKENRIKAKTSMDAIIAILQAKLVEKGSVSVVEYSPVTPSVKSFAKIHTPLETKVGVLKKPVINIPAHQKLIPNSFESKTSEEDVFDISSMVSPVQALSIPRNKIEIGRELGKGAFGTVYEGTWDFRKVAVKCYEGGRLPERAVQEMRHEVSIMLRLDHECLVRFFGLVQEESHPAMLVMEYGANGSLFSYLHSTAEITWFQRLQLAEELARGLAYLHDKSIVHRDIKSLNIVLDRDHHAKWCDFGLAQLKQHATTTSKADASVGGSLAGTPHWMAPELFIRKSSTPSMPSDIWALGMVFFELASREIPYKNAQTQRQVESWIMNGEGEEVPADCIAQVPGFGVLMRRCWTVRDGRPTAAQLAAEMGVLAGDLVMLE